MGSSPFAIEEGRLMEHLVLAARARHLATLQRFMIHDLKAPLNALVLRVDLLQDALSGEDLAAASRHAGFVQKELSRFNTAFEIFAGEITHRPKDTGSCELTALITSTTDLVRPLALRRRVAVDVRRPEGAVKVCCPPSVAQHAVVELLLNAVSSSPEDTTVRLSLERTAVAARIDVKDEGPGIPNNVLDAAQEAPWTPGRSVTGVGLFVTRRLVEGQGGQLVISSANGDGTLARLLLPLVEQEENA